MMHTLTIDFGNGVTAGTGAPVRIIEHAGLESIPTQSNTVEHALTDGGYIASTRAGMRRLTFDLDFGNTIGWADVSRLFPSGSELTLTITRDGVTRTVKAVRDAEISALGGRGVLDPVAAQIPLLCSNPWLLGDPVLVASQGNIIGGLQYPIEFASTEEWDSVTVSGYDMSTVIDNPGDVEVGFTFDFLAVAAATPELHIGGEVMRFATMTAGQRITVDTTTQTIVFNGTNGFSRLTGSFIKLPRGSNAVVVKNMLGVCAISFTPAYEGV
jgi:hypothetical protein